MFTRLATIVVASLCTVAACAGEAPTGAGGHGTGGGGGGGGGTGSGGGEGSGSGSGSGGGGGMTATQFLTQMDMKYCDEAFTCKASFPTNQGVTFDQAFGTSASQCYSESDAQVMPAQVEAEITAGKIHFDSAAAASCVSGLTFPACATFWSAGPTYPAACANALVGTVADGGACVVDFDCSNAMSICDATTHKCGPDTSGGTGARTAPADGPTLRSVLRM